MACANCPNGMSSLGPAKSNGGLYIMDYIGDQVSVSVVGVGTGTIYNFGTKKKSFWASYLDVPGLFADPVHGTDLRSRVQ